MRVPLPWLREYVTPKLDQGAMTADDVGADLARVGLEEEAVHGGDVLGPLVVGRVLDFADEPQSNGRTIRWCLVDVGEPKPRGIVCGARNFATGDAVVVALPMHFFATIARPLVWLLGTSAGMIMRMMGLGSLSAEKVTEEEIRHLVSESHEQGVIDEDERNMLNRVLRLGDRSAESLMTPRTRITWLDAGATVEDNLAVMRETPYSRYPVLRGSDQDVMGILEVKHLAGRVCRDNSELMRDLRPALFVADSTNALKLLEIFREEQQTVALVVDEYGDIQGMVSINDLLGAVLGRAQASESAEDEPLVVERDDGSWLVDGRLSSEELREMLGVGDLPGEDDQDYTTAAGMVIARYGRIPHSGEHFDWKGWRIEVVDLDGARIDKLLIARALASPSALDE